MLWMAATLALAAAEPVSPAAGPVPAEIEEHYRDYNLVSAFSTPGERHAIAEGRDRPGDERLARIARLMRRLESQIEDFDPGILGPRERGPERQRDGVDPGIMGFGELRETGGTVRSDLLRITSCRIDEEKGEAWVRLDALALDHGSNVVLVGLYDSLASPDRRPALSELLRASGGPRLRTEEIHRWTRVDGEWRRAAATLVFVAE